MAHWKHTATRCAVEGCTRTRVRRWTTCALLSHYNLGKSLIGAGRVAPIPAPAPRAIRCRNCGELDGCLPGCTDRD